MSEEKNDGNIKERVNEMVTYNFSITKCPKQVYERFVKFCKEETNDNYSFGIKLLLDGMDSNVKEALLFEQYMELKERMIKIEEKLGSPVVKTPKTMGSKKDEGSDKNE